MIPLRAIINDGGIAKLEIPGPELDRKLNSFLHVQTTALCHAIVTLVVEKDIGSQEEIAEEL